VTPVDIRLEAAIRGTKYQESLIVQKLLKNPLKGKSIWMRMLRMITSIMKAANRRQKPAYSRAMALVICSMVVLPGLTPYYTTYVKTGGLHLGVIGRG
jgi:hypothetical protein